jgi:hypothetical protein
MKFVTNFKTTIIGLCILMLTIAFAMGLITLPEYTTTVGIFIGLGFALSKDADVND